MVEGEKNSKYKGLKPEIAAEIEMYESQYFREDKPIPFCGLMIYPATVREYEVFSNCTSCLTLNKNTTAEGIRMTHLEYLLTHISKNDNSGMLWSYKIQKLCEIVFHIKNGIKCKKCGHVIDYYSDVFEQYLAKTREAKTKDEELPTLECPECHEAEFIEMIKIFQDPQTKKYSLIIDGHTVSSKDFDRFRQIILFQNFPDYRDDSWVDPSLKQDYAARAELLYKKNKAHASIEEKVVALSITTQYKIEEIFNMPIRKFTMTLSMVEDLINYKITKSAMMSGMASFPKDYKLEHWLYKEEKDMYGDAYKDLDQAKAEASKVS